MDFQSPQQLRSIRDEILASKLTPNYLSPKTSGATPSSKSKSAGTESSSKTFEMIPPSRRTATIQPAYMPNIDRSSSAPSDEFPTELPPRPSACTCGPLTPEKPLRVCNCRYHNGGKGARRFPSLALHHSIKLPLCASLTSACMTLWLFMPMIALYPAAREDNVGLVLFAIFMFLWCVCNLGWSAFSFIKGGLWLRRGLKVMVAVNAFLMIWFAVAVTVVAVRLWSRIRPGRSRHENHDTELSSAKALGGICGSHP